MSILVAPRTTIPRSVVTDRGTWAMLMFIATEAMLFVCLFFSYYYLGHAAPKWPPEPPEYKLALVMLVVLLTSSAVLHIGEKAERAGASTARIWTGLTVALGTVFIGIQAIEYRHHLQKLRPTTNAYGSIFYTITSFHAAHVVLGVLMLAYVLLLPEIGPGGRPPHRPLHNASLYWHFVDLVWVLIVALLYVIPNLRT